MKKLILLMCALSTLFCALGFAEETPSRIGIVLLLDHSGSMEQDGKGKQALVAVKTTVEMIRKFKLENPKKQLYFWVVPFAGDAGKPVYEFLDKDPGPFDESSVEMNGDGTAIGTALGVGATMLQSDAGFTSRHLLVLTDGENNRGSEPLSVLKRIDESRPFVSRRIIPYGLNAEVFQPLKRYANVVGADQESINKTLVALTQDALSESIENSKLYDPCELTGESVKILSGVEAMNRFVEKDKILTFAEWKHKASEKRVEDLMLTACGKKDAGGALDGCLHEVCYSIYYGKKI